MALTAVPVGFVAGLFGIGGGLITVPFLYYIFGSLGIDQQYRMHLAVGTSFAIIIPTSVVSVLTHHKFNAVDFKVVKSKQAKNPRHEEVIITNAGDIEGATPAQRTVHRAFTKSKRSWNSCVGTNE